ncbi:MAG: MFS transporter, partial [Candidatus Eremiobacteraeota bacterium]|nr:MFS transporter [Candidatus Eremiobacteraeota bacterium]
MTPARAPAASMQHAEGLPAAARQYALLATGLGAFMSMMDVTIANVALPTIASDLGTSASASIWVVNAYQFALTMLIVPMAALSDIVGYARVYRIALCVFAVASLGCSLSHTLLILALARVLQGVGASAMTTTVGAINRLAYPRHMLGRAAGQSAMVVALGAAAGPVVGGLILSFAPWPWLFAINIPLSLLALILALRFVPNAPGTRHSFDLPSAVMSALSFGALITTITVLGHHGKPYVVLASAVVTVTIGAVFLRSQRRL